MLGDSSVAATLPVSDVEDAKDFYENTLGLEKENEDEGGITYKSGESKIYIYPSQHAGTNQATAAAWQVDDVAKVVEALKEKGVSFEHYDDLPGTTREGDVHMMGDVKGAWFKDPSGNILSIASGM